MAKPEPQSERSNPGRPPESPNSQSTSTDTDAPRIVGRQYHLYLPSVFYIIVTLFLGIGAFNAQNNLLFFVFGATLATLVVSGIISGTMMMGVSVRRVIEGSAEVGKPAPLAYRVTNLNRRLPLFALRITEWADKPPRQTKRARNNSEPAPAGRLGTTTAFASFVPRGGSILVPAQTRALRAGSAPLRGFVVSTIFPFGIAWKSIRVAHPARITVRHPTAALTGEVLATLEASGRAQRHASNAGRSDGEEFFGIREYTGGDPMRLIAWRASARSGDLRTRVQASPPRPAVRILIDLDGLDDEPVALIAPDATPRPDDPLGRAIAWPLRMLGFADDAPEESPPLLSPMDRALALAGSLATTLLDRGFAVQVLERDNRFGTPPGAGVRHRELILDTLALRRTLIDEPHRAGTATHQRAAPGLTVRLSTTGGSGAGQPATIAWSYDQLEHALPSETPAQALPESTAPGRRRPAPLSGGLAPS